MQAVLRIEVHVEEGGALIWKEYEQALAVGDTFTVQDREGPKVTVTLVEVRDADQ